MLFKLVDVTNRRQARRIDGWMKSGIDTALQGRNARGKALGILSLMMIKIAWGCYAAGFPDYASTIDSINFLR